MGNVSDIGSEYQVLLNKIDGKDYFTLKIERDQYKDSSIDSNITDIIRSLIKNKIYVTPDVEVVEYGSLPRSVRKTKRVSDLREP